MIPLFSVMLARNLRALLRWFLLSSSLRFNYSKSEIFGFNLDGDELAYLSGILGCVSYSLPSSYLGLLLCIGSPIVGVHYSKIQYATCFVERIILIFWWQNHHVEVHILTIASLFPASF